MNDFVRGENERWLKRSGQERGSLLNSQLEEHETFETLKAEEKIDPSGMYTAKRPGREV